VLKQAARSMLPAEVIDRPKGYFPVPGLKYLQGQTLEWVRDSLTGSNARARGLFNPDNVDRLLQDPAAHITPLRDSRLWQLAVLERWLHTHRVTPSLAAFSRPISNPCAAARPPPGNVCRPATPSRASSRRTA